MSIPQSQDLILQTILLEREQRQSVIATVPPGERSGQSSSPRTRPMWVESGTSGRSLRASPERRASNDCQRA